jgi:hypothetical protein
MPMPALVSSMPMPNYEKKATGRNKENGLQCKPSRVKATCKQKGYMQNGRMQAETGLWSL